MKLLTSYILFIFLLCFNTIMYAQVDSYVYSEEYPYELTDYFFCDTEYYCCISLEDSSFIKKIESKQPIQNIKYIRYIKTRTNKILDSLFFSSLLKYFPNLKSLEIDATNGIVFFDGIEKLKNLENLNIYYNNVFDNSYSIVIPQDFSPISYIPNLKKLFIKNYPKLSFKEIYINPNTQFVTDYSNTIIEPINEFVLFQNINKRSFDCVGENSPELFYIETMGTSLQKHKIHKDAYMYNVEKTYSTNKKNKDTYTLYYTSDSVAIQGKFSNGQPDSTWYFFYPSNKLTDYENFNDFRFWGFRYNYSIERFKDSILQDSSYFKVIYPYIYEGSRGWERAWGIYNLDNHNKEELIKLHKYYKLKDKRKLNNLAEKYFEKYKIDTLPQPIDYGSTRIQSHISPNDSVAYIVYYNYINNLNIDIQRAWGLYSLFILDKEKLPQIYNLYKKGKTKKINKLADTYFYKYQYFNNTKYHIKRYIKLKNNHIVEVANANTSSNLTGVIRYKFIENYTIAFLSQKNESTWAIYDSISKTYLSVSFSKDKYNGSCYLNYNRGISNELCYYSEKKPVSPYI